MGTRNTGKDGGSEEEQGEIATLVASARAQAIRLLARRDHSRKELCIKLCARGHAMPAINAAVAELADAGLQSDFRFVEGFVRSALARGQGEIKIRAALRQRGIDDDMAAPHLELDDAQWREHAAAALVKRFGTALAEDRAKLAQRMRFLAQRGFPFEVAKRTVAQASQGKHGEHGRHRESGAVRCAL